MTPREFLGIGRIGINLRKVSFRRLGLANLSRMPAAMAPLALVLAEGGSRSALAAGSVLVSAFTLGEILLSSRLAALGDRIEIRSALLRLMVPLAAAWLAFGLLSPYFSHPWVFLVLAALAFAVGGLGAGLFGIARRLVVDGERSPERGGLSLERLMAIDTSLMEAFFFVAPLLVTGAIFLGGPSYAAFGVVTISAATIIATRKFSRASVTNVGSGRGFGAKTHNALSVWISRRRAWVYLASGAMGIAEGGFIVAIPAILLQRHLGIAYAGLMVGLLSVGSIFGGLAVARFPRIINRIPIRSRLSMLLLALAIGVVILTRLHSVIAIALVTITSGLFVAPLNTTRALAIESLVAETQKAEGFGALYGSYSIGFALVGVALGAFSTSIPPSTILACAATGSVAVALWLLVVKGDALHPGGSFRGA